MERPSFLSPTAPGARKNVRARLAARKENVSPPSPEEVAAALKARQELAAANRELKDAYAQCEEMKKRLTGRESSMKMKWKIKCS